MLKDRITLLLTASVIGLGALNWHVLTTEIDVSPIHPPARPKQTAAPVEALPQNPVKSLADFGETLERPLFSVTRRPPVKAEPPPPPVVQQRQDSTGIVLVGVMHDASGTRRALIRWGKDNEARWTWPGDRINGWSVRNIAEKEVVIEASGQVESLTLR